MFEYLSDNYARLLTEFGRHVTIVVISGRKRVADIVIYFASVLMTIPSLALFGFMVIALAPMGAGIGVPPAVTALVIYSFLPIIRNTVVAIKAVDPGMIAAARGMGMTGWQILRKIRLPLALPIIFAGVRNAAVLGVSVTTIAYLIGARGLGYFIFSGLSRSRIEMVVVGALAVALLGVGTNYLLLVVEEAITPKGIKVAREA
jgi:osmoprotectant transport system permease protein